MSPAVYHIYVVYPLVVLWPPSTSNAPLLYGFYLLGAGTLMYALGGVIVGFAICGLRRLLNWANDERWS